MWLTTTFVLSSADAHRTITPPVNTGTDPAELDQFSSAGIAQAKKITPTIASLRDAANYTSADVSLQQDMTMGATVDQKKLGLTVQNKNTDAILDCSTKKPLSDVTLVSNSGIFNKAAS